MSLSLQGWLAATTSPVSTVQNLSPYGPQDWETTAYMDLDIFLLGSLAMWGGFDNFAAYKLMRYAYLAPVIGAASTFVLPVAPEGTTLGSSDVEISSVSDYHRTRPTVFQMVRDLIS